MVGRTLVATWRLAGSACGKRRRGRPLNSVVRPQNTLLCISTVWITLFLQSPTLARPVTFTPRSSE